MEKLAINEYIEKEKNIQDFFLRYLDNESDSEDNYQNLIQYLEDQKIRESELETKLFLHLLTKIAKYHYRSPTFYSKIEKVISFFKDKIKQSLSNSEIYDIFKGNKRILLYLIKDDILKMNQPIVKQMNTKKYQNAGYLDFLYPEINAFLDQTTKSTFFQKHKGIMDNFEEKRNDGESESRIGQIIRADSIDELISYMKKHSISATTKKKESIFETNAFLIKNKSNLIEYAAFFGSFKIFNHLLPTCNELSPLLWLYAIHGQNLDIIHLFLKCDIELKDDFKKECLKEAIKCHSNSIAEFIVKNFFDGNISILDEFGSTAVKYGNYHYFPNKIKSNDVFYELCKYNYATIISDSLNDIDQIENSKAILKKIVFFKQNSKQN